MNGQQLKNSILQMAVQGKLVPQDPNDEPASVLVERIRAEKERLIKEKKIKKDKNPSYIFRGADNLPYEQVGKNEPVCIAEEVPFDIPDSWEWIRFGNLVNFSMGKTPPRKEPEYWSNPAYKWVSIADLVAGGHVDSTKEGVSSYAAEKTFKNNISPAGTLLMSFKLTVGKTSILDTDAFHNEAIISIFPYIDDNKAVTNYLFKVLPLISQLGDTKSAIKGATLNSDSIFNLMVPLPPLNEQYRIVGKLNEVDPSLLDYTVSEEQSSLLYNSFPERLKKSILQWAVQGKLVPQDPSDEPASVLLERIREEKARLVKEGKLKKDKNESIIFRRDNSHYEKLGSVERCIDDEIPFEIPESWAWIRLGSLIRIESGKGLTTKNMHPGNIPVYGGNGIAGYHDSPLVQKPTVVIGRVGYYCGSVHVTESKAWITDNAFITTYPEDSIDRGYLVHCLRSMDLGRNNNATAQPVVSGKKIYPLLFPLPPLNEQRRISNELDKLLPVCSLF